jgi:hypothetical protein
VRKNAIIAGLLVWNVVLMVALVFLWAETRRAKMSASGVIVATTPPASNGVPGGQTFTYQPGDRLVGEKAPQIVGRELTLTVTFDTQGRDGVIVAHGGLAQGYALYVQDAELLFAVRRNNALTTLSGGKVAAGKQVATVTLSKSGEMGLTVGTKQVGTSQAGGGIPAEPVDGFDVGGDRGAAVGPYTVPNDFGGTIESVSLKTVP